MKPKAQTLAQKFGFMDPDLSTPQHDAIMLWLDKYVTDEIAAMTYGNMPDFKWELYGADDWSKENFPRFIRENKIFIAPSTPCFALTSKVWESPILDRGFTIGFIDLDVSCAECAIDWKPVVRAFNSFVREHGEGSINEFPFPYVIEQTKALNYGHQSIKHRYYEVKPTISSLGEVIRQVRMYQTYTNRERYGEWWIVSPDARFKEPLESQGIHFLAVPDGI